MLKRHERSLPYSCWRKAKSNERVFVLLARDAAAPATIRAWVDERIRLGKNTIQDAQIREALDCADFMEEEGAKLRGTVNSGTPEALEGQKGKE